MNIIQIKNNKTKNQTIKSDILNLNSNYSREKLRPSLKWIENLKSKEKEKSNVNSSNTKFSIQRIGIKKDEMIDNAKIHREANRPLKKLKEFTSLTRFCQCCSLPVKDSIYLRNFYFCENIDEYAECGRGTSLYFSYYKFAILILIFTLIVMALPSLILTNYYTNQIINICYKIYDFQKEKINITFPSCIEFIDLGYSNFFNRDIAWVLKFNSINLRQYRQIYNNFTKSYNNADKTLINYSLMHFIGLISIFIINVLYIILLYNLNKHYDISNTTPSDYTVIITNLYFAFKIFWKKINIINKYIKEQNGNNKNIVNNAGYGNIINSPRIRLKEIDELGLENIPNDKEINILEAFNNFIKNIICETSKRDKFNIYQINICYKINEFMKIQEKIQNKNNEIYKVEHDQNQIEKNNSLDLKDKNRHYFYYPLDIFELNIFPFNICEKHRTLSDIEKEKDKLEAQLKALLKRTETLNEDNFAGAIFVTFNSIEEAEKFLKPFPKNLIMTILMNIKNLKYFLFYCFIDDNKRKKFFLKRNIRVNIPPEPEDIIYENLEYSFCERLTRMLLIYFISFIIIFICFIIILFLNYLQINQQKGDINNKVIIKYSISITITLIISILNSIFRALLEYLTKKEKQISMTNYYLSYSVKLTVFTFVTSGIIPFVSSYYYTSQLNYDILVTNMLTMFLSNSFLTPIMWTMNFGFLYKKLKICYVERNKKFYTQKELNNLYELLDMGIAYKYSYIAKTLLMTFFYMPIFPLSVLFSLIGFIFGYFLEKFNFSRMYKKPEMLNDKICEFYSNFFILNFFILCIGDYIFLKDTYNSNIWSIFSLFFFGILIIIPYNQILIFDFIGIKESEIKKNQKYEDYYFSFYNDYERNNPITKKEGIKHFLKKLIEKALITEKEYKLVLKNIEKINLFETYYKARINFSQNILQKAFLSLGKNETNKLKRRNSKFISNFKEFIKHNKVNALTKFLFPGNILGNIINENMNNDDNNYDNLMKNNDNCIDNNIYEGVFNNINDNFNYNLNFSKKNNRVIKGNKNLFLNNLQESNNIIIIKNNNNNSSERSED